MIFKKITIMAAFLIAAPSLYGMGAFRQIAQTFKEIGWPEHYEEERKTAASSIEHIVDEFLRTGDAKGLEGNFKTVFADKPHLDYARLQFENGKDPLYLAITAENKQNGLALLKFLLQRPDIELNNVIYWDTRTVGNETLSFGKTPLLVAISAANPEAASELLKQKSIELGKQGRKELSKAERKEKTAREYGEMFKLAKPVYEGVNPQEMLSMEMDKVSRSSNPEDRMRSRKFEDIEALLLQSEKRK